MSFTAGSIGGNYSVKLSTSNSPWKYDGKRNADNGTVWAHQGMTTNSNIEPHDNVQPYISVYIWCRIS